MSERCQGKREDNNKEKGRWQYFGNEKRKSWNLHRNRLFEKNHAAAR
jgi:hypothetical protein